MLNIGILLRVAYLAHLQFAAVSAAWRELVISHPVSGVQVHDARLVAVMQVERVVPLLTLNARDFVRYPWLTVLTPEAVLDGTRP